MDVIVRVIAVVGGSLGIISSWYVVMRVGFRVDELWTRRVAADQMINVVAILQERCDELWEARREIERLARELAVLSERTANLNQFLLNKAESEAKVKHAIRERS